MLYRFSAELWMHQGEAAWHFLTLPIEVADEIDEVTVGTRRGFGSVRVKVRVGSTTWFTSIFPDAASQSFVLPVKKKVREDERLEDREVVDVIVELADFAAPR